VPLLPASLTEPLWVQFSTLFNEDDRPEFAATHPWGCHRRPIPNPVVFDHVLAALVHGSGYKRIATPGCSDRTIRRRLLDWAERDVGVDLLKAALAAYDQMIGLDLADLSVDGSITKSPCGGELSGRSPVDRGKQGTKRSVVIDGLTCDPADNRRPRLAALSDPISSPMFPVVIVSLATPESLGWSGHRIGCAVLWLIPVTPLGLRLGSRFCWGCGSSGCCGWRRSSPCAGGSRTRR